MKNYNLTLISGSDYTVANMSATGFNNLFFAAGGEAQFTPDNSSAGNITIWDSTEKDGKSISATTSVEAGKPYVGSWESSEQTTNTFTTFENAKAYGLTKLQLSQVLGGVKRNLTSADRNYPANNPDGIALWKLPSGMYYNPSNQKCYAGSSVTGPGASSWANWSSKNWVLVLRYPSTTSDIVEIIRFGNTAGVQKFSGTMWHSNPNNFPVRVDGWALWRDPDSIVNSLNGSAQTLPQALDARQGKVLNESKLAVDNLLAGTGVTLTKAGEGASQTITVSAGGGIRTLTEDDYNFPEDNPQYIALWKLPIGQYKITPGTMYRRYTGESAATRGYDVFASISLIEAGTDCLIITTDGGYSGAIRCFYTSTSSGASRYGVGAYMRNGQYGNVYNALDFTGSDSTAGSTNAGYVALDARQGKVLNESKLSIANLEVGEGLKITTTGSGANTKVKIELVSSDEESF